MMAERQASIEGRLYIEARQTGLNPPDLATLSKIANLAAKEYRAHRAEVKILAQELAIKHSLSEKVATDCAKDVLRYKETHGEKPSSSQMAAMVQISRELDKQDYLISTGEANIEYLRRRDGDLQFREMASQGKDLSGFKDFPHREQSYSQPHAIVKSYGTPSHGTNKPTPRVEENAKDYEMEMSM